MEEKLCFATCEKDILQKNSVLFPNKVNNTVGNLEFFSTKKLLLKWINFVAEWYQIKSFFSFIF